MTRLPQLGVAVREVRDLLFSSVSGFVGRAFDLLFGLLFGGLGRFGRLRRDDRDPTAAAVVDDATAAVVDDATAAVVHLATAAVIDDAAAAVVNLTTAAVVDDAAAAGVDNATAAGRNHTAAARCNNYTAAAAAVRGLTMTTTTEVRSFPADHHSQQQNCTEH